MFSLSAYAQEPTATPAPGETLLHPLSITIGRTAPLPSSVTAQKSAVLAVDFQINQRRAAEAASAELPGLWRASFWQYLPKSTGNTLNSPTAGDEDLLLTPGYLTFSARLLEREVDLSDKRANLLFAK